jgi:tRNA(adenine34) deaminase
MGNQFMLAAIEAAREAEKFSEVPIGAVIVKNNRIISTGFNTRETAEDVLGHAEINAIKNATKALGGWRLTDCDIYVTIEPCPMCIGAIYQSRIRKIYYGAKDLKSGACGSIFNFFELEGLNHYCDIEGGIEEEKCLNLLKSFFKNKR